MSEKPLYVNLKRYGVHEEDKLVKRVEDSYLYGTFGQLLNYMVDSKGDDLNHPYNNFEVGLADDFRMWIRDANNGSAFKTNLYGVVDDDKIGPIGLNEIVGDYSDQLISHRSEEVEGEVVNFKGLDLMLKKLEMGGL